MSADLVTWLRAQLDDDERVARQLIASPGGFYLEAETEQTDLMSAGAHVFRWSPARVLREVEAKRLRLGEIERDLADDPDNDTALWLLRVEALPYAGEPGYREAVSIWGSVDMHGPDGRVDQAWADVTTVQDGDVAETPDCYDCGRQWADCTCDGPQT